MVSIQQSLKAFLENFEVNMVFDRNWQEV